MHLYKLRVSSNLHELKPADSCVTRQLDGSLVAERCKFLAFPQHRQSYRRIPCHAPLLKHIFTPQRAD